MTILATDEPLLEAADEIALACDIEAGLFAREARQAGRHPHGASVEELRMLEERGECARQRYVRANLRLVAMVALREARRSRLSDSDLFQEGCLGLIQAVMRFDHQRGCRFATYALIWIRAYVQAATASRCGQLNVPVSRAEKLRQVRGIESCLAQSLGRLATAADIAAEIGKDEQWVSRLLAVEAPQSLDSPESASAWELADDRAADPFDQVLTQSGHGEQLLAQLEDLERRVLQLRYGFDDGSAHSYTDTARQLSLSVTKVRRIETRALRLLRACCPTDMLAAR